MLSSIVQILTAWGLPGLFLLALLDSAGVPLPTGVDVLVTLLAAAKPGLAPWVVLIATTGSTAGCVVLFYLARKGGQGYLDAKTQTGTGKLLREWFQRYGLVTVFVSVLSPIPLPTKALVLSAGALGVSPVTFLLVVIAGRVPRYAGLAWLGRELGMHSAAWLRAHAWHFTGAALALALALLLLVRYARRSPA